MTTLSSLNGMNLANNEFIEIKEKIEGKSTYTFCGLNDEIFYLVFDNNDKYFKIIYDKNDLTYRLKYENSYRQPDLKKILIAFKYRNEVDDQNVFHYEGLKIVNISTIFKSYYDENLKKDVYTKNPKYYAYLLEYNGFCTILSYNDNKYSTKYINIDQSDYI